MKIQFTYTYPDALAAGHLTARLRSAANHAGLVAVIIAFFGVTALAISDSWDSQSRTSDARIMYTVAVLCFGWTALTLVRLYLLPLLPWTASRARWKSRQRYLHPFEVDISEDRLVWTSGGVIHIYPWTAFRDVRVTAQLYALLITDTEFLYIPRRALSTDPAADAELRRLLRCIKAPAPPASPAFEVRPQRSA